MASCAELPPTAMDNKACIYVFGDQSTSFLDDLQELVVINDDATLRHFLSQSFHTIAQEVISLPILERRSFLRVETLGLLLELYRTHQPHPALENAFLCIFQVAHYLQ